MTSRTLGVYRQEGTTAYRAVVLLTNRRAGFHLLTHCDLCLADDADPDYLPLLARYIVLQQVAKNIARARGR